MWNLFSCLFFFFFCIGSKKILRYFLPCNAYLSTNFTVFSILTFQLSFSLYHIFFNYFILDCILLGRYLCHARYQFSSVTQSCPTLCDPMNRSTPDLPVHHQLPEFTQTHIHRVGDAIQPSHPLSSPSPLAPDPSQHQGLFQ